MAANSENKSLWTSLRNPIIILLLTGLITLSVFTRFYKLDTAPAGGDGDVAWLAIEAVDWLDRGAYPYYVDAAHFPAPIVIALIALSILINGISIETPRLVTAFGSILIVIMMLPTAWLLLADDESNERRILVGLMAVAAAATSLHAMNMARLGVNTTTLPVFITLSLLTVALAWQYGGFGKWMLAGICLALTQYIYISAHLMGAVAILWFAHAAIATRQQFKQRWRGWIVMAWSTFLIYLPNLILYLRWSEAFTQRLDTTSVSNVEKLIWTHDFSTSGGMHTFIIEKLYNSALRVGFPWVSSYLPLSTPVLTPLFFIGWLVGIILCIWRFRRTAYGWTLLALPTLAMADVLTSISINPNPMRQIALIPFHYLIAGFGLGEILLWLIRYLPSLVRNIIFGILAILAIVPTVTGFYQYIAIDVPRHYANPETSWHINQTDLDISERINAQPEQSYLLPYGEYTRKNIAWLTMEEFRQRHSAISNDGHLTIERIPEQIIVIQPTEPQRARHTQTVGLTRPHWWVLLHDGQVYFLPPIDDTQLADLLGSMNEVNPEILIDASDKHIADLYPINTPETLFNIQDYTPVDANFSLNNQDPEIRLLGYTVFPADPVPGEEFEVSLYWQPLQRLSRNYEITVQLWDDNDTSYGNSHTLPYDSTYRTRVWREDEIVVTHHILFLSDTMPIGRYHLSVALVQHLANQNLLVTGSNAGRNNRWAQASDFRILPLDYNTQPITTPLATNIYFSDLLQLEGLEITTGEEILTPFGTWRLHAGDTFTTRFKWNVLASPPVDYSFFVHVIHENDADLISQQDLTLGTAGLPSGAWRMGDHWENTVDIRIPDNVDAGLYNVWFGIYYYADGSRLTIQLDDELQPNDRILLGQFIIE